MSVDAVSIKRPVRLEHVHECLGVLTEYARSQGFAKTAKHIDVSASLSVFLTIFH